MKTTTQKLRFGRLFVTTCGALTLGLTLGLGSVAAEKIDYQPGDAAGHAAADLQAANERQEAGVIWSNILTRPVVVAGDAGGRVEIEMRYANEREQAGFARLFEDDETV